MQKFRSSEKGEISAGWRGWESCREETGRAGGGASQSLKRGLMFHEVAETKYHKLGGLNQQRCILLHFLGLEV